MCKSCISTKMMRGIALFSGKIYTAGTNFTRPPVVTVATNLNSECWWQLSFITCISGNKHIHKSIIFSVKLSCYDIARPFSYQMLIGTAFTRSCIFQQLKRDVVNFIRCYNQFGKQRKIAHYHFQLFAPFARYPVFRMLVFRPEKSSSQRQNEM